MPFSRWFKLAVLGLAVAIAGCNRERGSEAQPQASAGASGSTAAADTGAKKLTGTLDRSQKGSPIPGITLTDAAGKRVALASFKGKPLLVNLWATWCVPCVVELPMLDKLAATRGDLKVLTVSQDMSGTEKVAPFLAERGGAHLEPWLDAKNDLAFHYQAGTLPTTVYYDAQGKEVWRYVGGHDWTGDEAAKLLAEVQ